MELGVPGIWAVTRHGVGAQAPAKQPKEGGGRRTEVRTTPEEGGSFNSIRSYKKVK